MHRDLILGLFFGSKITSFLDCLHYKMLFLVKDDFKRFFCIQICTFFLLIIILKLNWQFFTFNLSIVELSKD
jgi:hypothetical protein